jgi:HSP20 family protein
MDSLFNGFVSPARNSAGRDSLFMPALDIVETADGYEIKADLPGIKKEDLSVNVKENLLTIEAETRDESVQKEGSTVISSERRIGKYHRTLRLGKAVDESRISAEYNDGVLKLVLPRSVEVEGRKIDVDIH